MNNQRGFTLAEMLVVCAIVGLVMASLLGLTMQGQQAYWFGTTQVDGQQTVRVALERMAKEIREAGYEPLPGETDPTACPNATNYPLYTSGVPCYKFVPVTSPSATSLTLQYNWDGSTCAVPCSPINTGALVTDPMTCPTAACRGEQITYALRQQHHAPGDRGRLGPGGHRERHQRLTFTYRDENNVTASPTSSGLSRSR
jgi:prepilin-type N-terminal cleavage/methylation domain-containing protein